MKKQNKKKNDYKFNLKAWLIASTFSIVSATVGIVNLVLALTRNK